jgi:SH3 domain protein
MGKLTWCLIFICLCFLPVQGNVLAETMYVTDQLYLSVRSEPEEGQPSVGVIHSDTRVEVVETLEEWARVILDDGRTGWVMKKYLVKDLPKSAFLEELRSEIKNKSLTIDDLERQTMDMSLKIEELEGQIQDKSRLIEKLEEQVKNRPPPIEASEEQIQDMSLVIEKLEKENVSLKEEISGLMSSRAREAAMKREIEDLRNRMTQQSENPAGGTTRTSLTKRKETYLIGIGALLGGFIIGYLMKRPNRNRYYLR